MNGFPTKPDWKDRRIEELTEKVIALETALKAAVEAGSFWKSYYTNELESCEKEITKCREEEDACGRNFFQGVKSGLINHDIGLTRFKNAITLAKACGVTGGDAE